MSVADYEHYAKRCLDVNAWAYLDGGAADELTLAANRQAYSQLQLEGRVLVDVTGGHTRMELFGQKLAHPMLLAPVAHQGLFHPDGELATVQAAAALETCMVVSTLASHRIEDIAAAALRPLWFQLYMQPDRNHSLALVRRAEAAGYQALVLTVDAPIAGLRNREQRAGFALPEGLRAVNLDGVPTPALALQPGQSAVFDHWMRLAPNWRDVEALRAQTSLPLLIKGITNAHDAGIALELGVDGLVVSNHGGRTLDTMAPSLLCLPAIVQAVQGRVPVLMDGGIRRGSDVSKALALGADAVLLGRSWVYALAAAGALGVSHVLRLLRDELELTMALTGCATLADIGPDRLRR